MAFYGCQCSVYLDVLLVDSKCGWLPLSCPPRFAMVPTQSTLHIHRFRTTLSQISQWFRGVVGYHVSLTH